MTRQPDDPGPDYEGTRYDQNGDPVMPWDKTNPWPLGAFKAAFILGFLIYGIAIPLALLIWWLT